MVIDLSHCVLSNGHAGKRFFVLNCIVAAFGDMVKHILKYIVHSIYANQFVHRCACIILLVLLNDCNNNIKIPPFRRSGFGVRIPASCPFDTVRSFFYNEGTAAMVPRVAFNRA